jgi:Fe-S-cluster containining protein
MGARAICAQCALAKGAVCCEVAPGEKLATLTFADMARIEAATGLLRAHFVEREDLDPAVRLAYETARPLYRGMFVGGVRHGLRARKGACVFLEGGAGCRLPPDALPMACRLYPFDFDLAGRLTLIDAPHCLALEQARDLKELLRMMGASRRSLEKLRKQARTEVEEHAAELGRRRR